jgi:hypothetical protein
MPDNEHSTQEVTTMADWEEYTDELRDNNELLCLPVGGEFGIIT